LVSPSITSGVVISVATFTWYGFVSSANAGAAAAASDSNSTHERSFMATPPRDGVALLR